MPITFERIRDLLVDLESAINCYDLLKRDIREIMSNTQFDPHTKLSYIDSTLAESAAPPRALAQVERRYYNGNKRRNERMRDKQRLRRRNNGVLPRPSTPQVILSEVESKQLDAVRYEVPETETAEARQERALILAHARTVEIFKARGAFPRSALIEFAMGINRQVEQLVEDLVAKDWLDTDDGRNYFPLDRATGEVIAQSAKTEREASPASNA